MENPFRKSPLNYVGGKYRLLPQLKTLFPTKIGKFVDMFCGGLNVSMNVEANEYIANDNSTPTIKLYKYFQENQQDAILQAIDAIIEEYGISKVNMEGYLKLRKDYNEHRDSPRLMVLISNAFNHQLRFNSKGEFNMPFGRERSHFNKSMKNNLIGLVSFIQKNNIQFVNKDFREIEINGDEFIYCDPPYQNSTAVYNTGWTQKEDNDLLELLDKASHKGCKFALSCVLIHNGIHNIVIEDWAQKYHIHKMKWLYSNASYHKKDRSEGLEVCITNYK